jgi:hypothetical protein
MVGLSQHGFRVVVVVTSPSLKFAHNLAPETLPGNLLQQVDPVITAAAPATSVFAGIETSGNPCFVLWEPLCGGGQLCVNLIYFCSCCGPCTVSFRLEFGWREGRVGKWWLLWDDIIRWDVSDCWPTCCSRPWWC